MLFCNCAYAQKAVFNPKQYVLWEENVELSWDYFLLKSNKNATKNKSKNSVEEAARIATGISWSFEINEKENMIVVYVQTYLDKKASWTLYHNKKKIEADPDNSNKVLNHELGHFNITEIYARKSRMLISEINAKSFGEVDKKVKKIVTDINDKSRKEQKQYDKETAHGTNAEKQAEWDKKIAERLKELEQHKNIAVTIHLNKQ